MAKKISIALQGGGAHGSFAWGVMDRLFEDGRFEIESVSGTSAGGMNAAAAVQGLIKGGAEGARATLKDYWKTMSDLAKKTSPFNLSAFDKAMKYYNLDRTPGYLALIYSLPYLSPYDTNPMGLNPFEDFIKDFFDFKAIKGSTKHRVYLGTTHVGTGKVKVFSNEQISADVLMATACLPFLFQAIKIEGEYYWDGGYIANPAIFPLFNKGVKDIVVIKLRNTHFEGVPKTAAEIDNRLKEITYNGAIVHEMRAIHFISKLIDEKKIKEGALTKTNMHIIENEQAFKGLNLSSALNTDWDFLTMLFNEGRKTADRWIKEHYDKVGVKHSIDESIFDDFV